MRCPNCRTLVLFSAGEAGDSGTLIRCPRCPAVWLARGGADGTARTPAEAPPMTRRGSMIIEGKLAMTASAQDRPVAASRSFTFRRYGLAAGAVAIVFALAAIVLLAPDVSALPGIALLEGVR